MSNFKFFSLRVGNLKLDNLSGLCTETIDIATPIVPGLGFPLLDAKLNALTTDTATLRSLMNRWQGSPLTPQLKALDDRINSLFAETKRTVKTAEKSSVAPKAAAAQLLMPVLKPFWQVTREPLASQSAQLEELFSRIGARQDLQDAMATLDLSGVWTTLVTADTTFNTLYDQRLEEQASAAAPSATSIKDTVVKDYDDLCTTVEQTISTLPSPALELLFGQMDLLRKKYAARHPSKLDPSVTTVEPIPAQAYTGRPVTPLPRVFFKTGEQTIELHFAQDFTVTYNNNVEIGEATLIIHGKGQYSGQRITTFYIVGSEA